MFKRRSSLVYSMDCFKCDILAKNFSFEIQMREKKAFSSRRKTIIILIFSSHQVPTSQLLSSELTKLWARTFLSTMINLAEGYLNALTSCVFTIIAASPFHQQSLPQAFIAVIDGENVSKERKKPEECNWYIFLFL